MKSKNLLILIIVALTVGLGLFLFLGSKEKYNYVSQLSVERSNYKSYLASDTTLIPSGDTSGIHFFAIDSSYKVNAKVELLKRNDIVHVPTSSGENRKFIKHSKLLFTLKDTALSLTLLRDIESSNFFLPFSDNTSAQETYGAGRYLPVQYVEGKDLTLDFNLAFNPKCAYNHIYTCPVPPAENHLNIKVRAGEKTYVKIPASQRAIP